MNRLWKMPFVALFTIFALVTFSFTANASEKWPYEYEFKAGTGPDLFNGIAPLKQLEITFDEMDSSKLAGLTNRDIYVQQGNVRLPIIKGWTTSGNKLIVTFENIDLLDYTKMLDFDLIIKEGSLHQNHIEDFKLPFTISDLLPGFKSIFMDIADPDVINNRIFKYNAPRDITVHVPQMYIEKIETIHRYDGWVPDAGNNQQPVTNHALTNIDVLANDKVTRLKVKLNDSSNPAYDRDLDRHTAIKGFTMGQAGIEAVEVAQKESARSFQLKAYDNYGRLLETRNFPLLVMNSDKGFKYNGYLPKADKAFGKPVTLYALMADSKLLETVMTRIPVSELDSLGITYANLIAPVVTVSSEEQLQLALSNEKIKNINLNNNTIVLNDPLIINRNVTISNGGLDGDVELDGQDITVQLKDVVISGTLTIDVGANGTVVAEDVQINGGNAIAGNPSVIIRSGGINSIYLFGFETENGIVLENTTPLRIVTNSNIPALTMNGTGEVTLEGLYGTVTVTENAKLIMKPNTIIEQIDIEEDKTLLLMKPEGKPSPTINRPGNVTIENSPPVEGEDTQPTIEWVYSGAAPKMNASDWTTLGEFINMGNESPQDNPVPSEISWSVADKNVFGGTSEVTFVDNVLKIQNLSFGDEELREWVTIEGLHSNGTLYKMTILVTVSVNID